MEHLDKLSLPRLTYHASLRMQQRALSPRALSAALLEGRKIRQHGGYRVFFLGNKEVSKARKKGLDLRSFRNMAVVLSPEGVVITVMHAARPPRGIH